ncbi:MAG: metallophosphoesterase [Thermomicrobiales bacterium]
MVNRRRFVLVGLIVAVAVAVVGAGPLALDRFGYCLEDVLPVDTELTTDPYVQHVTRDSAVIRWWTADETAGTVAWGRGAQLDEEVSVASGESHAALLTGLEAGQEYRYRVQGDGVDANGTFRTAPDETATVTIGVVGDTGTGGDAQHEVAAVLRSMDPDFVLITGDVVYRRGGLCHYEEKFFDPYAELIASAPLYAAVGNHDLLAEGGAAFDDVFGIDNETGRWFSFDHGPVHVVVLDSEVYHEPDQAAIDQQRAWLDADLGATSLPWTVAVLHRPPHSSTPDQAEPTIRADLAPLFASHGVDVVLAGHAHNYERFVPIDGVTYVVTGGGGADLHEMDAGMNTAASAVEYHAVELVVAPDSLSLEAIDRDGNVLDTMSLDQDEG